MTKAIDAAPVAAAATIDPTVGFRRRAGAIALPLAFALQVATNSIYAWATRDGGGDTGPGDEALAFYAAHLGEITLATNLALIGCLLAIPGLLAAMRVLRPGKPRLSLVAGVLMIAGYVCYFGIVFSNFDTLPLARLGVDAGAALDARSSVPMAMAFFLIFVIGNLIGTLLLGIAVILSRSVPWWAGVLIIGWPVGHVINLVLTNEWFAVAGGALEVIGLAVVSSIALRTPDAQWVRQG